MTSGGAVFGALERLEDVRMIALNALSIESLGRLELRIDVHDDAPVLSIAWGEHEKEGKFSGELDEMVISCLCDDQDRIDGGLDPGSSQLL